MAKELYPSEHLIKLATVNELDTVLRYSKQYDELVSGMLGLFQEILKYCEDNHIEIPDHKRFYRIVSKVQSTMLSRTADETLQEKRRRGLDTTRILVVVILRLMRQEIVGVNCRLIAGSVAYTK